MSILPRVFRISVIATLAVACCACFPEATRLQTATPGEQMVPQDTLIYVKPDDGCKQWLTDHPSAITSITSNGKSKSVNHYYGCRGLDRLKELERLEQAIDDAVNSAQWIR